MRHILSPIALAVLILALLVGCGTALEVDNETATSPPTATRAALAPVLPSATSLPPTATILPSVTIKVTPVATPSATLRPLVLVAVPPAWEQAALAATAGLADAPWRWQVLVTPEPAAMLANSEVQLALVQGEAGVPVGKQPLALAVPFTTPWEAISLAEAEAIQVNGHELVTILPWAELSPKLKVLQVDGHHPADPEYPLQESLSLQATVGYEDAAALLAPALAAARNPDDGLLLLTAVGDVMLDRALGNAIKNGDLDYPFALVAPLLQEADIAVGNLESALGDTGQPANKSYTFRAPPAAAQSLAWSGFDVISLANNHALDYGADTLLQGIRLLQEAGLQTVGAGANARAAHAPALWQAEGMTIAFLGYVHVPVEGAPSFDTETWTATDETPGLAWAIPEQIADDVAAARRQADHVVVLLHSGYEYVPSPSEPQRAAARAAIDAGASLVIGHHAHILQGIEFYNGGVIAYGLANFAFTIDGPPETALLNVWLDRDGVRALEVVPAIVQWDGQPRLATVEEAETIRRRVYTLTNALNPH